MKKSLETRRGQDLDSEEEMRRKEKEELVPVLTAMLRSIDSMEIGDGGEEGKEDEEKPISKKM